jgi:hypothetical protein
MRIAILMHGLAGKTDKYGTGTNVDVRLSYDHLKKHILTVNPDDQIDFFMHSWSFEQEDNIKEIYAPKKAVFEPQIIFDFEYTVGNENGPGGESNVWVDGKFKGVDNLRFHSLFSRWYSAKIANDLKKSYERENGFEYDFVMLSRYDLAYVVDFEFNKFSKDKFYAIPPVSHHGIQDLWFISNSQTMNQFCQMFDWISGIKHFPHKFIHSHWLAMKFLIESGISERLDFFGPPRPWDLGRAGVKNGSAPLVRDYYDLAVLTPDEDMGKVRNEIKNNAKQVIRC